MTTAAELVEWLESGGVITTTDKDPEHAVFLRFEICELKNGTVFKYLGAGGWGSACGSVEEKLKNVLYEPYKWVKVEKAETREELDKNIKAALEKVWHKEGESITPG